MCLEYKEKIEIPEDKICYKVFLKNHDLYYPAVMGSIEGMKLGKLYKDINKEKKTEYFCLESNATTYKLGFHVFTSARHARSFMVMMQLDNNHVICKVKIGRVLATGTQQGLSVIVCKALTILEEV